MHLDSWQDSLIYVGIAYISEACYWYPKTNFPICVVFVFVDAIDFHRSAWILFKDAMDFPKNS